MVALRYPLTPSGNFMYHQIQQDRQCPYEHNIESRSRNRAYRRRAISITYSGCVFVALVIQYVKRIRHIALAFVACLAVPVFRLIS
jgi:hypothetical protein